MKRHGYKELLRAIEDNEKRGWHVVGKITPVYRNYRSFGYDEFRKRYAEFEHTEMSTLFCVRMRKEEKE